jgi:GNAT superfamily N-acetyltransferase
VIRQARVEDLPLIEPGAREFYQKSEFLRNLDMEHFKRNWTVLLTSGTGVIFLFDEGQGFIGGVRFPDMNNGELVATECFWFVREDARGHGWRLYRAFERWARESGCKQIQMVHLADSMPERLAKFYENIGFKRAEVRYCKELICQ